MFERLNQNFMKIRISLVEGLLSTGPTPSSFYTYSASVKLVRLNLSKLRSGPQLTNKQTSLPMSALNFAQLHSRSENNLKNFSLKITLHKFQSPTAFSGLLPNKTPVNMVAWSWSQLTLVAGSKYLNLKKDQLGT